MSRSLEYVLLKIKCVAAGRFESHVEPDRPAGQLLPTHALK